MLFFKGDYSIKIFPGNYEEQKTLIYLYKSPVFLAHATSGTFVLKEKYIDLLLKNRNKYSKDLKKSDIIFLRGELAGFQKEYGIQQKGFKGYSYPPFTKQLNILIFKNKKLNYSYIYDKNNSRIQFYLIILIKKQS